jgi:hypothetical protein
MARWRRWPSIRRAGGTGGLVAFGAFGWVGKHQDGRATMGHPWRRNESGARDSSGGSRSSSSGRRLEDGARREASKPKKAGRLWWLDTAACGGESRARWCRIVREKTRQVRPRWGSERRKAGSLQCPW